MNILVIEDDHDIREMICQSLSQADYHTRGCSDVKSAKQSIREHRPDCLVIDWMLPDSSGIELIRWLRRKDEFRQIPALMLTARSQESDKITGLDAGADDYMTKPLSLRELRARVQALLRRPSEYRESSNVLEAGPTDPASSEIITDSVSQSSKRTINIHIIYIHIYIYIYIYIYILVLFWNIF